MPRISFSEPIPPNTRRIGLVLTIITALGAAAIVPTFSAAPVRANDILSGQNVGMVGGAVAGGVLGNKLGGQHKLLGTAAGVLGGGTVGGVVGNMIDNHSKKAAAAPSALKNADPITTGSISHAGKSFAATRSTGITGGGSGAGAIANKLGGKAKVMEAVRGKIATGTTGSTIGSLIKH